MLFEFVQYTGYVLLVLTFVYFIPAMILIVMAFKKINIGSNQDNVALFSFGAFIKQGK